MIKPVAEICDLLDTIKKENLLQMILWRAKTSIVRLI